MQPFEASVPELPSGHVELLRGQPVSAEHSEAAYLRGYWRILRNRRWTILSTVCVIFTMVTIYTVREKPTYQAKSLIEVEQENPNIVTVQEIFQMSDVSEDYLNTQYKILQSDSLARHVIRRLHLDRMEEFDPASHPWFWRVRGAQPFGNRGSRDMAAEQAVLSNFKTRLAVTPVAQSRLIEVAFQDRDPQLAAAVVNTLIASYIQQNLQAHWQASQQASAWISQQIDGVKIQLEDSEDKLQAYAQANGLLFLESPQGQYQDIINQRLRELQDELTEAQADLYGKEAMNRLLRAGDEAALPGVFDNATMENLTDQLAGLEEKQAQLTPHFRASYPEMQEIQSQIDRIHILLKQQQQHAARHIQDEYVAAEQRVALVQAAFTQQQKEANLVAGKSVQYNILKREVETNQQLYDSLLQRLKEAGVSSELRASNIRVVDAAVPPIAPIKPRIALNLGVGLFVGLVCGAGLAFFQEHMDDTVNTADEVENFLRAPVLAMIPSGRVAHSGENGSQKATPQTLTAKSPETFLSRAAENASSRENQTGNGWFRVDAVALQNSPAAEAIRTLRAAVLLSAASHPPQSLLFVSAEPGEGKTTVCGNLAISLAQLGKRVLLIDADMRLPRTHDFFRVSGSAGLVNYLTGDLEWQSLVQPSGIDGLDCLVSGPTPPNPGELILSARMRALLSEATTDYDFALIDAPPLLSVADGRILAALAEGVVMVLKRGATPREMARRAQIQVAEAGGHMIGVVLNHANLHRAGYPYYLGYACSRAERNDADGNSKS